MTTSWRSAVRVIALSALLLPMIAACATGGGLGATVKRGAFTSSEYGVAVSPRVTSNPNPPRGGGRQQIGKPYTVRGKTYVPQHDPNYSASGTASWYGADFHGRRTANGEIFSANHITAAHPTLPLPSYVRVTNTDNGRSLVVRVNDRGPYVSGRIIDLSHRAASMLGYVNKGSANVQVAYVGEAPLNGDDTRTLVASYSGPADYDNGPIRVASSGGESNRSLVGMTTSFFNGLFSYADTTPQQADAAIGSAHAAANAMASGNGGLADWAASVDADNRRVAIGLGVYAEPGNAARLAQEFALLGAVSEEAVTSNGRAATRLTLTYLKPGVIEQDALDLARELGLNDIVLY
ncbi:septal ring lytic transglycosylase RlpA family protein [Devosia sp. YIM 151766]|uniref:septal ring lytic transglycosylase RlpA family protein n=1 Tax=Devosia sp. YIM 151766 TaxID=3017325 RepID=UPI00255C68C7|nr:septal ring lytic transglycosylase RlpA family protein [Devosia sp. YIM 151766]WIY54364.1 septal ring lytic transglycosylase RlpA family protein [Devosia sp. YIM 151766]